MIVFRYDAPLLERFPTIRGGVILARGLTNGPTPRALAETFRAEQAAVRARLGDHPLSDIPALAAWRRAFSAFGVEPTKYRSAAESLLRRLTKKGDIPSLNLLVDLGNLVSIRYALPLAFFDRHAMHGSLTVRFATGEERFTDLGTEEVVHPEPGEVIFADETGLVFARRWCWRQSEQSASREDTAEALITVEGHHTNAETDVRAALTDLQSLLTTYCPAATLHADVLSPDRPALLVSADQP